VADLGHWKGLRYYQDEGTFVEINDTFADTCQHTVMTHSILGTNPFFVTSVVYKIPMNRSKKEVT